MGTEYRMRMNEDGGPPAVRQRLTKAERAWHHMHTAQATHRKSTTPYGASSARLGGARIKWRRRESLPPQYSGRLGWLVSLRLDLGAHLLTSRAASLARAYLPR